MSALSLSLCVCMYAGVTVCVWRLGEFTYACVYVCIHVQVHAKICVASR